MRTAKPMGVFTVFGSEKPLVGARFGALRLHRTAHGIQLDNLVRNLSRDNFTTCDAIIVK